MGFSRTKSTAPQAQQQSSGATSSSSTWNESQSSSFRDADSIWGGQEGFLGDLYRGAQGLKNNFSDYQNQGQELYNQAAAGFGSMMNPGMNPQMQAYQDEVQRNLERNILPGVGQDAMGVGQYGSARHGIQTGLAASDANRQITDMAANLYGQDRDRMNQAMAMAPGLANMGMGIPWYAQNQYAGLLGAPSILGGAAGSQATGSGGGSSVSQQQAQGTSLGGGGGGGIDFGLWPH